MMRSPEGGADHSDHGHDHDHADHSDHGHDHDHGDPDVAGTAHAGPGDHDGDHDHSVSPESDRRYLTITLGLLSAFMVFEVATAFVSHSLALLADAGHMLADVGAIAGSLIALRLAARPETGSHTFGMKRAEILAAVGNGIGTGHVRVHRTAGASHQSARPNAHRRCRGRRGGQSVGYLDVGQSQPTVPQH
jgi:Co/Zn/Cd efflux system component